MPRSRPIAAMAIVALLAGLALSIGLPMPRAQDAGRPAHDILPYDDPVAVAEGRAVYDGFCAACHGANLEGEADWRSPGPDGRAKAPPHDASGHTWHHPSAQLFAITKFGTAALVGNGYESNMIGFGDVLSDDEILAVLAYIKSTWPEEIRAVHSERNRLSGN